MTWRFIPHVSIYPSFSQNGFERPCTLNIHRQQLRYSEKKWFCMLSMCTSACIMQHHTTSCNMRSEVKTYEDPNSRIVLAPHEPIFLRTHDKTWQNNANLSNIFDKKTNSIRQEKFHREHVDLVRNVQRQDISTNFDNGINGVLLFTPAEATSTEPHQQTFHDLSAELMWVF